MGSASSVLNFPPRRLLELRRGICLPALPTGLDRLNQRPAVPTLLRHPFARNGDMTVPEYQPVVHRLRFVPRLRSRLTLSGRAFLRKP